MPLVYGMQALMVNKTVNGHNEIAWVQPPMTFLQNNLGKIVKYYSGIINICDYDPQKVGKMRRAMNRHLLDLRWLLLVFYDMISFVAILL